ncbi:MAG: hypothetical protein RL328_2858 [Acidobacteriota bacterium]
MISRRFLLGIAVSSLVPGAEKLVVPSELSKFEDAATELPLTRLTSPEHTSVLPVGAVARKGFLLYGSDRSGRFEAFRLDLKKGESQQLTDAEALDPHSLMLLPGESGFCYFAAGRLMSQPFSAVRPTQWAKVSDGFQGAGSIAVSADGLYAAFLEAKGATHRLRLVTVRTGVVTTLAESDEAMGGPVVRPKRASVLYRRGTGVYLANFDGKQNYRLRTLEGSVAQAQWSPDGRTVVYLHVPAEAGKLRSLREFTPDSNDDKPIADTTQFAAFSRNADGSVFVGASGSKASPYVLLLVRTVKRELTLAEHRASDPALVNPQFSPNSQQVFFASDLHGKPAIYRMDVDRLVSDTAQSEALYK